MDSKVFYDVVLISFVFFSVHDLSVFLQPVFRKSFVPFFLANIVSKCPVLACKPFAQRAVEGNDPVFVSLE